MIVIPPILITSSVLASSTVAEPSAGEVVWNAATSYAVGDVVIRTTTHRKYECQIAGVDSTTPSSAQAGAVGYTRSILGHCSEATLAHGRKVVSAVQEEVGALKVSRVSMVMSVVHTTQAVDINHQNPSVLVVTP